MPLAWCSTRERIGEAPAVRRDRRLRDVRHAVHRVRKPHAVPVHGRFLRKRVHDGDVEPPALLEAKYRARHAAVVRPHVGVGIRGAEHRKPHGRGA